MGCLWLWLGWREREGLVLQDHDNDDDEIKDIDEFALVEHSVKGECLTVRPEWLKYLKASQPFLCLADHSR